MTGDIHPREAELLSLGEVADLWAKEVEIHDLTYDNVLARLNQWFWEGRFCRSRSGADDIHDPVHVARRLKRDAKIPDGWTPEEADPVDPPHYDPEFLRSAPLTFYSDAELEILKNILVPRELLVKACLQTRTAIPVFWKDGKAAYKMSSSARAEMAFFVLVKKGQRVTREDAFTELRTVFPHLSPHKFSRIWSKHAPENWKKGGRPKSTGFSEDPIASSERERFELGKFSKSSSAANTLPLKEREQLPLGLLAKHWAGPVAIDKQADESLSKLLSWLWRGYFQLKDDRKGDSPNITNPKHIARTLKSLGGSDFSKHPTNAEIPDYTIETLKDVEFWHYSERQLDYLKSMPVTREQLHLACRRTRTPFPEAWERGIAEINRMEEREATIIFEKYRVDGKHLTRRGFNKELKATFPSLTDDRLGRIWWQFASNEQRGK